MNKSFIVIFTVLGGALLGLFVITDSQKSHASAQFVKGTGGMNTLEVNAPIGYYVCVLTVVPRYLISALKHHAVTENYFLSSGASTGPALGLFDKSSQSSNGCPPSGSHDNIPFDKLYQLTNHLSCIKDKDSVFEREVYSRCGTYVIVSKKDYTTEKLEADVASWTVQLPSK